MADLENETEIRWMKHDSNAFVSILGKDVVVISSGNFITFVESSRPEKKEILYNANSEVRGDGIECICTHGSLSCFAFSEKCRNPRILILSYPSFEIFKSFESLTDTNYIALRFSDMEFLVAITGIPDFKIIIWNWKTGEKLYSQDTQLQSINQILRVSPTSPLQILQSVRESTEVIFWDMSLCYKKTLLQKFKVALPESSVPPYSFAYGADGDVYVVDFSGCLYSINSETHESSLHFAYSGYQIPDFIPCVVWYKGGVAFTNPSEVVFFRRKSPEGWTKIWSHSPKNRVRALMASTLKDLLLAATVTNEILVFKGENQVECITLKTYGGDFDFVSFVYPLGDFFVTFGNKTKAFYVWNKKTGQKVCQYAWGEEMIRSLESNPKWPYLVAATDCGSAHIINFYDPNQPMELDEIPLTKNPLDAVRFRNPGTQFCVGNLEIGEFFLIKVLSKMEVIAYVKVGLKIVDYGVLEKEVNDGILVVVPMSQLCCRSGQTILLYSLDEKRKSFIHVKDVETPTIITSFLPSPDYQKDIICVPHRSRKLYIFNLAYGKITKEYVSGHQMKIISLQTDGEYLYTFGIDGLVIVKVSEAKTCATLFSSHHRLAKGVKALAVDSYSSYVITLGGNGSLVCTQLKKLEEPARRTDFEALMLSSAYKQLLQAPLASIMKISEKQSVDLEKGFELPKETKSVWLHLREQELINAEELQNRKEKQKILEDFSSLKRKLCQLLDENMNNVPERRLPIQAFDLDKHGRRKKLEDAKTEREKEKQFRLALMKNLSKITEIIKSTCCDTVAIKAREIRGIFSPVSVQSYALLPERQTFKLNFSWLSEIKRLRLFFNLGDFFEPWVPRTSSALELHLNNTFQVSSADVTQTIKTKFEEEQMEDDKTATESDDQLSKLVWSGTSTHNFIEVDPKHYTQFELTTFYQAHQEVNFIESDIRKLMLWFNKNFADMFESKEREMAFVNERNNRLRHIISELSFFNFSPDICKTQITDPEWAPEENPETIKTVKENEITVPMFVSESMMEIIKKKEAEEERLRQMLMADDFKEKALITMMDGVLEKLWEDEIKKDVPKPKCMVEKEPESWTEEDLKAVRVYEEAVRFLASERERYRKILEAEWAKTISTVKDSVAKFDEKVSKLHLLKLKVESAVGQEILKILRIRQKCLRRIEFSRKKDHLKLSIIKNENKMEAMNAELVKLQEMLTECKGFYENLQNKDKNLDKNFKREFTDYSPIICEQLYKLSKKRPKLLQKAGTYSTVLTDVGKCAVSGTKPEHMPAECIQYLKDLDALDAYSNAPASVSQQSWELACKLRRMKIETELKIKACAIDLADAETTVAAYQKSLKTAKEHHNHLQNELHTVRTDKITNALNYPIQLVLKRGLVEIPLSGQLSDFEESVLVTKDTINEVNKAIQKMGHQKIKAMKKAANFRKGIIYKEWEHKKLRMEIEDLKRQLDVVEKQQVLKELQAILVARARGFSDEKGFLYLENELSKVKEKFEKSQTETFEKVDDLNLKIEALTKKNQELDSKIMELNVEVNELNLERDKDFDKKKMDENMKKMRKVRERSKIVRKIQEQHNEILVLQTELELLRLKTYPTIKYKIS